MAVAKVPARNRCRMKGVVLAVVGTSLGGSGGVGCGGKVAFEDDGVGGEAGDGPCALPAAISSLEAVDLHGCASTVDLSSASLIRVAGEGKGEAGVRGLLTQWTVDFSHEGDLRRVRIDTLAGTIVHSVVGMDHCLAAAIVPIVSTSAVPSAAAKLGVSSYSSTVRVWFNQGNECSFEDTGGQAHLTFSEPESTSTYDHAEVAPNGGISTCEDCVSFDPEGCCTGL